MAIQVKNNSFYRRVPISTSGAVKLLTQFKDLPTAEATNLTLEGGPGANRIVFSGSTPPDPPFGGGKLVGGFLTLTASSTDVTKTGRLPQVALYKTKEGTQIKEGGLFLGTSGSGGGSLFVTTTTFDENIPNLEENFDGASKSLGEVPTVGVHGGGRNVFSDEYLFPEDAAEKVHAGGDYSMFHIGEDPEESGADFMRRYFGREAGATAGEEGGMGIWTNRLIFVRPRNRKKPHGFWTNKYDNRTGLNKYTVFAPVWKYNDIKGVIKFVKRNPAADTEPPELTKNNTIFEFLGKSPTNETLSTMDPDSSTPWSQSFLQLSSEVAYEGGTSLEMSHIWSYTSAAPNSNVVYGDPSTINPQFSVIGGPIIPYPMALDNALAVGKVFNSSGAVARTPIETATLSAAFSPYPEAGDIITNNATYASATKFFYVSYYNYDTKKVGGYSSGSAWSTGETCYLFDQNGLALDTSSPPTLGAISSDSGGRLADTGGGSNAVAPFVQMKVNIAKMDGTIFASGNGTGTDAILAQKYIDATQASGSGYQNITGTTGDAPMRTFLRSFTVTLGNYAAKPGECMDRYVARGLKDAYLLDELVTNEDKKSIGGITFQRFIDNSQDHDNSYIIASPLHTRSSMYDFTNADMDKLYLFKGAKTRGTFTEAGTTVTGNANILIEGAKLDPDTKENSYAYDRATATNDYEPCIRLNMNEFFDMKLVFSLQGKEIGGSPNTTTGSSDPRSAVCRAYIQQGEIETSDAGNPIVPSLPVYFPVSGGYDKTGGSRNVLEPWSIYEDASDETGYPSAKECYRASHMFPKYIYLWCQNYRYWDKTATGSLALNTDGFWGDGSSSVTILQDTATEKSGERGVQVFVDSITLNNFNSQTENNSAGAGVLSRPITLRESSITGFMGVDYTTATNTYTAVNMDQGMNYNNQNVGGFPQFPDARGVELPKRYLPAYVSIGFESGTTDLYTQANSIGGNDYTGWLLWNGFASDNFSALSRNDLHTTNAWYSTGYGLQYMGAAATSDRNSMYLRYFGRDMFSDYNRGTGNSELSGVAGRAPFSASYGVIGNDYTGSTAFAPVSLSLYTGSENTVLGNDGFCSKGTVRLNMHNGAQTTIASIAGSDYTLTSATNFTDTGSIVITTDKGVIEGSYKGKTGNVLNNVSVSSETADTLVADTPAGSDVINQAQPWLNSVYNWAKRENPLSAAKVIAAPRYDEGEELAGYNGAIIEVDDAGIFNEGTLGDTEYIMWRQSGGVVNSPPVITGNIEISQIGAFSQFATNGADCLMGMKQARRRDGNIIFFDTKINRTVADLNVGNDWYISPRKYWVNLAIYPGDAGSMIDGQPESFPGQAGLPFVGTNYKGEPASLTTDFNRKAISRSASKFYDTIALLSGSGDPAPANTGSTYNEWTYSWNSTQAANALVGTSAQAGVYGKSWILDKAEKTETNLDLSQDYGWGTFDQDTGDGGEVDVKTVYAGEQVPFDLSQVVKKNNSGPSESFVTTINLYSPTTEQSAVLYGNDYATATDEPDWHLIKPHYLFRYFDELPEINNMQVGPAFNVLDRETNLYELQNENLSGISFTWEESGDDVWYRMLFVNDAPISNKYCNAELWMPLNESGNSGACPAYTFYKPTDGFLQLPHASAGAMTSSTDYLFILHTTPMLTSASGGSLYSKGTASSDGFEVSINAAGKVVVQQKGVSLTGTTQLDRDNDVNYQIAVRYQQTGVKKFALYVNGKEEAYNGTAPSAVDSTAVTYIGSGSVGRYEGIIEEIVYYEIDKTKNDVQFVETSGEYIYNNPYLLDKTGTGAADTTYTHYGRIALFDYHNVRGRGRTQVAMSNTTAWRGTAL